jgi:diguanylate cyclase (GGDEF)-like protein/PAS domain S-box-containing protein
MFGLLNASSASSVDARLKQFVEELPQLFAELDAHLRFVYCNGHYATWFGLEQERIVGRSIGQTLGPDAQQAVLAHYTRALEGEITQYQRMHRFPDGRQRHLSVALVPKHEGDRVTGVFAFGTDVTDAVAARSELKLTTKRLDSTLEATRLVTWDWNLEQDFVLLHGQWRDFLGGSVERAFQPADKLWMSIHPEDADRTRDHFMECAAGKRIQIDIEMRVRGKNGEWIWVRNFGRVEERGAAGRATRMFGTMSDVSVLRASKHAARDSENRFRALVELTSDWYWETGADHRVTRVEGFNGYPGFESVKTSAIGKTRWELHKTAMDAAGWARHKAVLDAHKPFDLTYRAIGPSGANTWIEIKGVPDFDAAQKFKGYHGSGKDVTKEVESKHHIAYLAQHDMLTGLVNRDQLARLLDRALREAADQHQSVALAYLDVDHFKHINDAFGHNLGDSVLREVAARLKRSVPGHAEVGRVGGDEFMVFVTGVDSVEAAAALGQALGAAVSVPMKLRHTMTTATASVGIALFPLHGDQADLLMNQADMALHEAKSAGRNCCMLFAPEMRERAQAARSLEAQLRKAITAGEFTLAWQPRVDLHTGRWTGGEALLRWPAAQQLKIGIQQVVEIAERAGLINDIGLWVAQTVCEQLVAWQQEGVTDFCGGFNVSVQQLADTRLFELLRERVPLLLPGTLEIEITESTLLQEADITLPLLQELRSMGIRIAMDDFGSGYSHFAQLRRMPVDIIKIDKSLVDDIATDTQARAVVEAIRALGKGLGMEMVAEGVELEVQAAVLRECGFELGQGYLWQRPCPPSEMLAGIRRTAGAGG